MAIIEHYIMQTETDNSAGIDATPSDRTTRLHLVRQLCRRAQCWLLDKGVRRRTAAMAAVIAAAVSLLLFRAVTSSAKPTASPLRQAEAITVAAEPITRAELCQEVSIPAEFRPYAQVELHAKVAGYVDQLSVDIGDRVKAGQLLAKLEVPELLAERDHALAAQKRAEADYEEAHLVYQRLQAVNREHPNLLAQQDLDSAEAKDRVTEAALAGARAEVGKCQTLLAYTRISAPFDGVVTRRFADPGALIQAGTSGQSTPLLCVSDNYRLRLDFPVSVAYVRNIHIGETVDVRVESLGGKTFAGKISRCAQKIEEQTRTMITEVEVPNPKLELVPGMYATVALKVERHLEALALPVEALSGEPRNSVYVVGQDQILREQPVTLGLETPTHYEVLTGLKAGDLVVVGDRSALKPGERVRPRLLGEMAKQ